jgi:hypothetical protein
MACSYHRRSRGFDIFDSNTTAHLHFCLLFSVPRESASHVVRSPTFTWFGNESISRHNLINWNKEQEEV